MKTLKFNANYNKETEKAIQISFYFQQAEYNNVWLPKSQINFLDKDEQGGCIVEIPLWLIKKQKASKYYSDTNHWVDVFRKQDRNGLSEYGYAL